jgi:hypothetical protein
MVICILAGAGGAWASMGVTRREKQGQDRGIEAHESIFIIDRKSLVKSDYSGVTSTAPAGLRFL